MNIEERAKKAESRVKKMRDHELLDWTEAALSGMQRHLDSYRATNEIAHLGELIIADVTLAAVLTELNIRHEAKEQEGLV